MDEYTEVEIVRFYNACAETERDHLRTLAIAGRVSQADKKAWKDFIRTLDRTVKSTTKPKSDLASDKGLGDFFKQAFVLTNPGEVQRAADKARKHGKPRPSSLSEIASSLPPLPITPPKGSDDGS